MIVGKGVCWAFPLGSVHSSHMWAAKGTRLSQGGYRHGAELASNGLELPPFLWSMHLDCLMEFTQLQCGLHNKFTCPPTLLNCLVLWSWTSDECSMVQCC